MTLANLRSDIRFLLFGNSSNTQYGDTDIDRNINGWYRRGVAWILENNGDWQVNGETALADLVADQREYTLPTDLLKINEVYIKSTTSGELLKAKQIDPANVSVDMDEYYPAQHEFDLLDNSLFVYPMENSVVAVTDGLKIFYQTEITELSGDSDAPNIAAPFERLITYGSAYDYAMAQGMTTKSQQLKRDLAEVREDMMQYYANRSTVDRTIIDPEPRNLT